MSEALTRAARQNPSRVRQFIKKGAGAVVFRSEAYRRLLLFKHFAASYFEAARAPHFFKDVRTYCMFVGHNKSGTSMVGALLDAHPEAVVSDEADALEFVRAGFSRDQVFHLLLRRARKEARKGRVTARRLQPYSYRVPGQWQGGFQTLRVIGDSTAGSSTKRIATDADILKRLGHTLAGVDLKIIQTVRNPYDPISAMMVRGGRSFENAIEAYFSYCETLAQLRSQLDETRLFTIRYEDFVRNGRTELANLCLFLGLEAGNDYLSACVSILHPGPETSRQWVFWDLPHIEQVAREMKRYDFLHGYEFEN